jgi:hypothetical protein
MNMEDTKSKEENSQDQSVLSDIYKALTERRISHDNLTWQTPALSLTAQAFLLTISLGPSESQVSRTIASIISIMISILSVQLIERHSFFETTFSKILEEFEKKYNYKLYLDEGEILPHAHINTLPQKLLGREGRFSKFKSRYLWMVLLLSFSFISLFIIFLTWVCPWILI